MCCPKWKYWKRWIWYSLKWGIMNHCWSQIPYWRALDRAEKEHESSLLESKERFLVRFKDNICDSFLQAQNDPVELLATKHCQSGVLSLLMGYVAIKIVFPCFTVEGWKFRRLFSFWLCSWGESAGHTWGRRALLRRWLHRYLQQMPASSIPHNLCLDLCDSSSSAAATVHGLEAVSVVPLAARWERSMSTVWMQRSLTTDCSPLLPQSAFHLSSKACWSSGMVYLQLATKHHTGPCSPYSCRVGGRRT